MWKSSKRTYQIIPNGISSVPLAMDVITVAPNPAEGGHFTISTTNAALVGRSAEVRLIDMSGRTAWSRNISFDASGAMQVNTEGLIRGTYVVQVTGASGLMARTKVVIM